MSRSRNWCFTINNYDQTHIDRLKTESTQTRFIIFGLEEGSVEHTPHIQGYVSFFNTKTLAQAKVFLGGDKVHLELAKGTPADNVAYCSKDGQVYTRGDLPNPGARTDIVAVRKMVAEGKTMGDIAQVATSYQSIRMAEVLMRYKPLQEREKPTVKWYWGATGTGKTRKAYEELGYADTWVSPESLKWFDGYDGQSGVIIDDFRGSSAAFHFLLKLLDRYPLKVPIKGGYVNWVPKTIIITSAHPPQTVYNDERIREDIQQLIRRIDEIKEFV